MPLPWTCATRARRAGLLAASSAVLSLGALACAHAPVKEPQGPARSTSATLPSAISAARPVAPGLVRAAAAEPGARGFGERVALAIAPDGTPIVAYSVAETTPGEAPHRGDGAPGVFLLSWDRGAVGFRPPMRVAVRGALASVDRPLAIAVSPAGTIAIAYLTRGPDGDVARATLSADRGLHWSDGAVPDGEREDRAISAVFAGGTLHVATVGAIPHQVAADVHGDEPTWVAQIPLRAPDGYRLAARDVALALDGHGEAGLLFSIDFVGTEAGAHDASWAFQRTRWEAATPIAPPESPPGAHAALAFQGISPRVAFERGERVLVTRAHDEGFNWERPVVVPGLSSEGDLALAITRRGSAAVLADHAHVSTALRCGAPAIARGDFARWSTCGLLASPSPRPNLDARSPALAASGDDIVAAFSIARDDGGWPAGVYVYRGP